MTGGPLTAPGERFGPLRSDPWTQLFAISILLGAFLRIWHLGTWSFWADEMFTITASGEGFTWADHRPLAFAMNHYLTIPLFGMSEVALRLFPAIAGILAVPLLGWCTARVYGAAAGALTAMLAALATPLIYWSQFGRYYAQAFLCSTAFVFFLLFAVREPSRRWAWLVASAAAFGIGWQFVPTIALSAGGVALWFVWNWRLLVAPDTRAFLYRYRMIVAVLAVVLGAGCVAVSVRLFDYMLEVTKLSAPYYTLPMIGTNLALGLGLPVTVLMAGGLLVSWRHDGANTADRSFVALVSIGSLASFVMAFYVISLVSPWHFVSLLPTFFSAAGIALAALWRQGARPLAPTVATAAVLAAGLPDLASYHIDGSRYDYRRGLALLSSLHAQDPGPVYGYGAALIRHMHPELDPSEFKPEADRLPWLEDSARTRTTWVVLPEGRRGPAFTEDLPGMQQLREHCREAGRIERSRYTYHRYAVVIYRCAAARVPVTME